MKIVNSFFAVNYFSKKPPSEILDWVLNSPLEINMEIYQKTLVLALFIREYQVGLRSAYDLGSRKFQYEMNIRYTKTRMSGTNTYNLETLKI